MPGKTKNNPEENIHERSKNNEFKQYQRTTMPIGKSHSMERHDFCRYLAQKGINN